MATTGFTVTGSAMKNAAEELQGLLEQYKGRMGELDSAEQQLNNMWDGDANDAFHKSFNNDKVQLQNFYNVIAKYINALSTALADYSKAEADAVNIANTRTYR